MRITPSTRVALPVLAATLLAAPVAAQTHDHPAPATAASPEAQQAFTLLKSLAGSWQGTIVEPFRKRTVMMDVNLRTTSRGNALLHDMKEAGVADDPMKNDHPVTMMYLDGANLLLTHYCDAGNRPRMTARLSPDGKTVDFDFLDVAGPTTRGHMQHVRFTIVDDTHHREAWTYELPDGKTVAGEVDLQRVANVAALPAK